MQPLEFEQDGEKKTVGRRMIVRCLLCSAEPLICPDDIDPWGWLRDNPDVKAYRELHMAHGNERSVGPQIVTIE